MLYYIIYVVDKVNLHIDEEGYITLRDRIRCSIFGKSFENGLFGDRTFLLELIELRPLR